MKLYIVSIWFLISLWVLYKNNKRWYWKHKHKLFISSSFIAFILFGWSIFDPNLSTYIGGIIEINPTWELSILFSLSIGVCITGPFTALYMLYNEIKFQKEKTNRRKER